MPLTIVANIHAKPGQEEQLLSELTKLVEPTRDEDGCIQYDLHRNNDDPAHFMFYETWKTRDLWQLHKHTAHITAFREVAKDVMDTMVVYEMERTDESATPA